MRQARRFVRRYLVRRNVGLTYIELNKISELKQFHGRKSLKIYCYAVIVVVVT